MQTLDSFLPFQFPVQVTIDGRTLDYLLTVDETGHVFEAIPTIFELPPVAQQLILGDSDEAIWRKIKAYTRLFKYLVPLVLAEKLPFHQAELLPLVTEIRKRLKEKGLIWAELPVSASENTLAMQVLSVFGAHKLAASKREAAWIMIIATLGDVHNLGEGKELFTIGSKYPELASDFFPTVIPFFKQHVQANAFSVISNVNIKTNTIKAYLIEELEHPSCVPCANNILQALKSFDPANKDIYAAVVRFYDRKNELADVFTLDTLMDILKHHFTQRTKEIGFEIIRMNHSQNAYHAAKTLIEIGVEENEILEVMMPVFSEAKDADSAAATFSVLSYCISPAYQPAPEEVLDVAIRILSKNKDKGITNSVPGIARKNKTYLLVNRLFELLHHEVAAVRAMILLAIGDFHSTLKVEFNGRETYFYLNYPTGIDFKPFMTTHFVTCYWDLTKDKDIDVVKTAIKLIGKIGYEQLRDDYIDPLLKLAEADSRKEIWPEVIQAINRILPRIPYPAQIEPFYLSALESYIYFGRPEAILGLSFSPNRAFKNSLKEKYANDRDKGVQRVIKQELFAVSKGRIMIKLLNLINRLRRLSTLKTTRKML